MSDDLVFYTNPMSRGRTVRWILEEVGEPYRTEIMDFANLKAPDYLAINPMGKIPAITHRGKVVTEVSAICAYLADAFPGAGLAPLIDQRADYYRWLFFVAGPFEAALTDKALGVEVPEARKAMVGYGSLAEVLDTLEAAVAEGPITGRFSAVDLFIAANLNFHMNMFGTIEKRPAFEAYVGAMIDRPAFKRATEIDDGLIAQAKASA